MGEKTGGLTIMVLVLVALVALLFVVNEAFPGMAKSIMESMKGIIENPLDEVSTIMLGMKIW